MNRPVRSLMLGWEFPPFISGGLGTACYGLTKAMDRLGMEVILLVPHSGPLRFGHTGPEYPPEEEERLSQSFEHVRVVPIPSYLKPYLSANAFARSSVDTPTPDMIGPADFWGLNALESSEIGTLYAKDIFRSVHDYARKSVDAAKRERFDVIHAHDWMTYPAALCAAKVSGKPVVAHVHSTEFDRSGENVDSSICRIEYEGLSRANKVVAVSRYTKNIVASRYQIPQEKIEVIYNGVEQDFEDPTVRPVRRYKRDRYVLFLGRITMQKGPEYFLHAARMVIDKRDDIRFIMAGAGDMLHRMVDLAARLKIGSKVLFTKFLNGPDVQRAYQLADLYVMPSVSEPFGIAPLEAMRQNVPVLISRQSGVAEVLKHSLKVDFWDIHQIANKIISVLSYPVLQDTLRQAGRREITQFRWENSAKQVGALYHRVLART